MLDYLSTLPDATDDVAPRPVDEAVAAVAVCLRWGSYLAVLLDRRQPLCRAAGTTGISRISDEEMARINIEASAALERWIEIRRRDPGRYRALVARSKHLPMSVGAAHDRERSRLVELTDPELARSLYAAVGDRGPQRLAEVEAAPTRALANAIINACWRNGPVEDIHAGRSFAYPLLECRATEVEEQILMATTIDRFAHAGLAIEMLIEERSERSWVQRVIPFHLVPGWLVTPTGWSLTECTRTIWLPGAERAAP